MVCQDYNDYLAARLADLQRLVIKAMRHVQTCSIDKALLALLDVLLTLDSLIEYRIEEVGRREAEDGKNS